jgi:hypothetical protein
MSKREQVQRIIDEAGLDDDARACLDRMLQKAFDALHSARANPTAHKDISIDITDDTRDLDPEMHRRVLFAFSEILHVYGARQK